MKAVDKLLNDYASYHQTRGNLLCHTIGIPLIVYSVIALSLLIRIPLMPLTAAELILGFAFVYYLALDYRLALLMLGSSVLLDLVARRIANPWLAVGAMISGWTLQFIGHAIYEKKSPAFFQNLQHLLIGPIFVINEYLHLREPAKAI